MELYYQAIRLALQRRDLGRRQRTLDNAAFDMVIDSGRSSFGSNSRAIRCQAQVGSTVKGRLIKVFENKLAAGYSKKSQATAKPWRLDMGWKHPPHVRSKKRIMGGRFFFNALFFLILKLGIPHRAVGIVRVIGKALLSVGKTNHG
jgi:hypothetical protein